MATGGDAEGAYGEDAPLLALFGTPSRTKLISVFVAEKGRDLTVSQLARQAGVSRTTVYDHLDDLLELGVVEETRTTNDGHSTLFQLNADSDIAELCYELEGITLKRLLEIDGHL